ncbi:BcPME1, pectin methyl esterase 1 [Amylocarpus encephaloides]|uniref:pectinesterase n=1 Tax=Amylocarpus encephaloides TaxID=45428 RepID=A0A9P7YQ58_9HELO|nr:BcPME1, pectin methyl esterase 1 [Amylocarpus encephaloides]
MKLSLLLAAFCSVVLANPPPSLPTRQEVVRTTPEQGSLIVSHNGTLGIYKTLQAAVNALSKTTTTAQSIFIYPGTYKEQVYIPALKGPVTIQGSTADARSYKNNTAELTYNLALKDVTSNDLTATLRNWSPNTKIYNLNIVNTFGHIATNGQNLAISAQATNQGYYGCQFRGYQDTILTNKGKQIYSNSLITGAVDFIYGSAGVAWFEEVDIRTIAQGAITASGRDSTANPSYFVINNSTVDGIDSTIAKASTFLGRPWRAFARVVFQHSYIGAIVKPAGWSVWSSTETRTSNVEFGEFNNTGPGASGPRASFGKRLGKGVGFAEVIGNSGGQWWIDASYM